SHAVEPALAEPALREIFASIADMEANSYAELLNWDVVRHGLAHPESRLARLFARTRTQRPTMAVVDMVSPVAGALNHEALRVLGLQEAIGTLNDSVALESFLNDHIASVERLALTRGNNPTVPQRALPVACLLSGGEGERAVVELGCSRGDIGGVLLNWEQVVKAPDRWLFPDWQASTSLEQLQAAPRIDRYIGVDLTLQTDDAWLLALWGLKDERRERLRQFYESHSPIETERFTRIESDALKTEQYLDKILPRLAGVKHLTVL